MRRLRRVLALYQEGQVSLACLVEEIASVLLSDALKPRLGDEEGLKDETQVGSGER